MREIIYFDFNLNGIPIIKMPAELLKSLTPGQQRIIREYYLKFENNNG
jgi:hypothetical protein